MVACIHVGNRAGDIAGEVADEPGSYRAYIFDGDETPLRRTFASLVDEVVKMITPTALSYGKASARPIT